MDRQDLYNELSSAMQGEAGSGTRASRVRAGQVKSRLIEAHPAEASPDGTQAMLEKMAEEGGLTVEALGDELWQLAADEDTYFVDAMNPRFWLLHSTARSSDIRRLLSRSLLPDPRVDRAWIGSTQLQQIEGDHRWVKTSFNADLMPPGQLGKGFPRRLKAQVEIDKADDFLAFISRSEDYQAGAVLTAVGTVLHEDEMGSAKVVADYQGAFSSSGSSFHLVAGLLWRALDRYEGYVKELESTYRLSTEATDESGLAFDGEVALIELPRRIDDVEGLMMNLFNCREPFRLWAVPRQVADFQWEANAVDLHVGHRLRLEVSPEWIRVMLGPETCGNTLARLVANLKHRFDARINVPDLVAA